MTDAPIPPPPPGVTPSHTAYHDASSLGTLTIVLLLVNIAMAAVLLVSTLSEIRFLERTQRTGTVSFEEARRNDDRQRALAGASSLVFFAAGIVWLVWVHRAHTNLDALGVRGLRFTHGWAVGGFLVPLLNIARSPQIMSELVRASDPGATGEEWKARPTPPLIWTWWAAYLIGFITRQAAVAAFADHSIHEIVTSDRIVVGMQVLIAIAGVLAVTLVRRVGASQVARATALGLA